MILKRWDLRFLEMSQLVASWSKDPSTKVGAVIIDDDRRVISLGYNGFPKGVADDERLDDREEKYKIVVHAERNALLFANINVKNCSIFTYPFMPCPICAGMIIQSGISRVVSFKSNNERWEKDFEISRKMFQEADIQLLEYEI
jgi:dCMP deaminase